MVMLRFNWYNILEISMTGFMDDGRSVERDGDAKEKTSDWN